MQGILLVYYPDITGRMEHKINNHRKHSKKGGFSQGPAAISPPKYAPNQRPSAWPPGEKMNPIDCIQYANKKCYPGTPTLTSGSGQNRGPTQYETGTK